MKAKAQETPDTRLWCASCCIRIAPNEDRVMDGDKGYHRDCYSKLKPAPKPRKK